MAADACLGANIIIDFSKFPRNFRDPNVLFRDFFSHTVAGEEFFRGEETPALKKKDTDNLL
jgi:hypothetical protein